MKKIGIIFLMVIAPMFTITRAQQDGFAVAMKVSSKDSLMLNRAFMSMEKQLVEAPVALAVLSQLCLIATERDFPLNDGKSSPVYKYLTYPDSFRASLNQVSQYGYFAFLEAHTGMHRIMLESTNTPDHLEEALNILFNGNQQDVEDLFPISIQKVKRIADTCTNIAQNVADEFETVQRVIGEFGTASINKQGSTQNLTIWTEQLKAQAEAEVVLRNKTLQDINQKYKDARQDLKRRSEQYDKAFDNMTPSMGSLLAGAMVDAFSTVTCLGLCGEKSTTVSDNGGQGDSGNFVLTTANNELTNELKELKDGLNFQAYFNSNGTINETVVLGNGSFVAVDKQIMMLDRKHKSISEKERYQKNIPSRKGKAIEAVLNLKELLEQLKNTALSDTEENANRDIQKQLANAMDQLISVMTNKINGPTVSNNELAFDLTMLSDYEAIRVGLLFGKNSINATLVNDTADEIIEILEKKVQTLQAHIQKGANEALTKNGMNATNELLAISRSLKDMVKQGVSTNLQQVNKRFGKVKKALNVIKFSKIPALLNEIASVTLEALPGTSNSGGGEQDISGSTNQKMMKSAYLKMQTAQGQMELAQKLADHEFERKMEKAREVDNLVLEIMAFKASEATLKEILAILGKAIKAIGELQKSWSKLVVFFREISNFIDVYLGSRLNDFVSQASVSAAGISKYNSGLSPMKKEILFNSAMEASKGSYMVNIQASTYHDISEAYLMPLVDNLGVLIALDSVNDRAKIAAMTKNMTIIAKQVPKKIIAIIKENQIEYGTNVNKRKEELTQYFERYYPKPPPKIEEKFKKIVGNVIEQVGFSEEAVDQVNPNDQVNSNEIPQWDEDDYDDYDY